MLIVHHLGISQSERIVWLCEELGIPYELKRYDRDAATRLAPAAYKALHPMGTAPIITDGSVVLAESGAIMAYIIGKYGHGRLAVGARIVDEVVAHGSSSYREEMAPIAPINFTHRVKLHIRLVQ